MNIPEKYKTMTVPADKLILLIAAIEQNGTWGANYKLMSALSAGQYTASSLEHNFRDLRKAAQALLKSNPDVSPKDAVAPSPKKRKREEENDAPTTDGAAPKAARKDKQEIKKTGQEESD